MDTFIDYYKLLGVPQTAGEDEIIQNYQKIMSNSDLTFEEKTAYNVATQILLNGTKRKEYDQEYEYRMRKSVVQSIEFQNGDLTAPWSDMFDKKYSQTKEGTCSTSSRSNKSKQENLGIEKTGQQNQQKVPVPGNQNIKRQENNQAKSSHKQKNVDNVPHHSVKKSTPKSSKSPKTKGTKSTKNPVSKKESEIKNLNINENTIGFFKKNGMAIKLITAGVILAGTITVINLLAAENKPNSKGETETTSQTEPTTSPTEAPTTTPEKEETYVLPPPADDEMLLYEYHVVAPRDTLSKLSKYSNLTEETIIEFNHLENDILKIGSIIVLPRYIKIDDIGYYTIGVYYDPSEMSFLEFAQKYETDPVTILMLNQMDPDFNYQDYHLSKKMFIVPNFVSHEEALAKKEADKPSGQSTTKEAESSSKQYTKK